MKERPILFSEPMIRAILNGTKTQTRRVLKPQPTGWAGGPGVWLPNGKPAPLVPMDDTVLPFGRAIACPYGQPGDRLWVRETWARIDGDRDERDAIAYRANGEAQADRWRPAIHMPRAASRITLEITSVRVERLQDISEADAIAEGTRGGHGSIPGYNHNATPVEHYRSLWEFIKGPWEANPWVWVVEFRRLEVRS